MTATSTDEHPEYATLIETLEANRSVDCSVTYLEADGAERRVSFAQLYERALGLLHHLQRLGAKPGDKMIIFLNNNEAFIDGFLGALCGRIIPVPLAVGISDEHRHKLLRIAKKLGTPFLYTDRKTLDRLGAFAAGIGEQSTFDALQKRCFLIDEITDLSTPGALQRPSPDDTAFIQFSSGSTSEPKGVVLTHRNLTANCRGAAIAGRFSDRDVSLSWMPLTHDMGLIGMFLMMFTARMQVYIMPTDLFIRRPLLWLKFASDKRATVLASPNFGYRHFLKVLGDRALENHDLSAVRIIFNGAEPISVDLCDEFMTRMAYTGLRREAMLPVYGLAEASLAVSFPVLGHVWRSIFLNRHQLNVGETVAHVGADSRDAAGFVAVGVPIPYCEVRLVDNDDRVLGEDRVGHLQIRGDNVTRGYYEAPDANAKALVDGGWVRTGDLAIWHGGELYITGRAKEIIFVNGQNYFPHDLESIAIRAKDLELGKVVAAGCRPKGAETDELTIFILHRGAMADFVPVANEVVRLINEHAGLEVAHVVPVKRIPKTTSGKIQRHLLEQSWLAGEFDEEIGEFAKLQEAAHAHGGGGASVVERKLKAIVDEAMAGKRVELNDNLFEVGASSLTLIQIHEQIDAEYPGLVDLTELFDYPTVAQLSRHLEGKLAATG